MILHHDVFGNAPETSNYPFSHGSLVCRQKRLRKFVSPWHSSTEKARGGWEKGGPAVEQVFKYGKGESGGTTDPGAAVHLHSHLTSREQVASVLKRVL